MGRYLTYHYITCNGFVHLQKYRINRAKRLLGLSQETYIKRMLERYHMQDSKPMDTSVDKSLSLSRDMCPKISEEKKKMSKILYASVVGSLMYTMMCTRPDISYVVGLVSRYQSNLGQKHWMKIKRILRYLKETSNYMLCYQWEKRFAIDKLV